MTRRYLPMAADAAAAQQASRREVSAVISPSKQPVEALLISQLDVSYSERKGRRIGLTSARRSRAGRSVLPDGRGAADWAGDCERCAGGFGRRSARGGGGDPPAGGGRAAGRAAGGGGLAHER